MYSTKRVLHNWLLPALVLLMVAVIFRFFSFFPTVINHDESTYILIGREILHGKHYFVDVIDTKPIGIFLFYSLFQWLIGDSIFLFRFFVAVGVAFTAFGLFAIVDQYLGNRNGAWIAGLSYILMTSLFTFFGVSPNTEIFFTGFVVAALWWILGGTQWWRFVLAGGALGIGFMIKYVVAFDALTFGLLAILLAYHKENQWWKGLGRSIIMLMSFLVPFGLAYQYYRLLGYEAEFLYYTFEVPGRYPVERLWGEGFLYFLDFLVRFLPVTALAIYTLVKGEKQLGDLRPFFILWLVLDGLIISWPGKSFGHYFIQWMPPFCLLAGIGASGNFPWLGYWRKMPRIWRLGMATVVTIAILLTQKNDYYDKWDHAKEVSEALTKRLEPGDQIYTGNYHQILYFLLKRETPTPYVHRTLLWAPHHISALGIDLVEETRQILALRPRFLTLENTPPPTLLADSLYKYYQPVEVIGGRVTIYERK